MIKHLTQSGYSRPLAVMLIALLSVLSLAFDIPIGNVLDFSKPLDGLVFSIYIFFAELYWGIIAPLLGVSLLLQAIHTWIVAQTPEILSLLGNPLGTLLGFTLILATLVYGVSQIVSGLVPSWKPVDMGKAMLYGIFGFFYLTSGVFLVETIENVRRGLGEGIVEFGAGTFTELLSSVSGNVPDDGFSIGNPFPISGDDGVRGVDIAASYVGVTGRPGIFGARLPQNLRSGYRYHPDYEAGGSNECCFMYAYDINAFTSLSDTERSEHLGYAKFGLMVLALGFLMTPYALAESLIWLILSTVALVIFISLPIGFVFSVFTSTSGLISKYINQYIELIKETIITGIFMGFVQAGLLASLFMSATALNAVMIIGFLVVTWRIFSATKLLSSAANNMMAGISEGSSLTINQAASAATGLAAGGVLAAAGVATGNAPLAMSGAMTAKRSMTAATQGGSAPSVEYALMGAAAATKRHQSMQQRKAAQGSGSSNGSGGSNNSGYSDSDGEDASALPTAETAVSAPTRQMRPVQAAQRQSSSGPSGNGQFSQLAHAQTSHNAAQDVDDPDADDPDTDADLSVKRVKGFMTYARRAQTEMGEVNQRYGAAGRRVASLAADPENRQHIGAASQGIAGRIEELSQQGLSQTEMVDAFRSDETRQELADQFPADSPFRAPENFNALADIMLQPERAIGYDNVVSAIAEGTRHPGSPDHTAAAALGMPSTESWGAYGGIVNRVGQLSQHVGANEIADPETGESYLDRAAQHIASGDRDSAQVELMRDGADAQVVGDLLDTLEVADSVMGDKTWSVPQTIAFEPGDQEGYWDYQQAQASIPAVTPEQVSNAKERLGQSSSAATPPRSSAVRRVLDNQPKSAAPADSSPSSPTVPTGASSSSSALRQPMQQTTRLGDN